MVFLVAQSIVHFNHLAWANRLVQLGFTQSKEHSALLASRINLVFKPNFGYIEIPIKRNYQYISA